MGLQTFDIEALLLVLPTTEYQKRVPVAIGTTITDVAVDFINQNKPDHVSKSWKVVCCATHSKRMVQTQPSQKGSIKTTRPVRLPPFYTTIVKGSTKLQNHGMQLNLIAESFQGHTITIRCAVCPYLLHLRTWLQQGCNRTEEHIIMVHNSTIQDGCRPTATSHNADSAGLW